EPGRARAGEDPHQHGEARRRRRLPRHAGPRAAPAPALAPRARARPGRRRPDRLPLLARGRHAARDRGARPPPDDDRVREDRRSVHAGGAGIVQAPPALTLRGVRRAFGPVLAVDGVDLELLPGEIHALVGENGAGKSTLAAIAYGAIAPDEGSIAASGSVGLVHQHFKLIERLRVWENVLLNREPRRGWAIDVPAARARVDALATTYGLAVDPDAVVETLPVGIEQRVELLRELDREPAVLLLDEPTAALAPSEIASFFTTIRALAARGTAILVVTHKLAEVIAYSQRVTVMRAGRVVARHLTGETTADAIAREMVGGEVPALAARAATQPAPLLELRGVSARSSISTLTDATFEVRAGEIVGIAGIEGNGQTALADALAGVVPFTGELRFDGEPLRPDDSPASRLSRG